jgi:hypothetical protein
MGVYLRASNAVVYGKMAVPNSLKIQRPRIVYVVLRAKTRDLL